MTNYKNFLNVSKSEDSSPDASVKFKNRTRFIILVICTLCLSIAQSDTLTLNFTIICMAGDQPQPNHTFIDDVLQNNSLYQLEEHIAQGHYAYTPNQKNLLFSLVAVGAMVAVYPVMLLIQKFGSRNIVFLMGLLSAVTTALIPLMAYLGFYWLLFMRFLQGTGLSTIFTLIGIVTRQWSMQVQNAFYIAFLTCFFQIAPIFTMPIAGALCTSSFGWPSVYYLHAVVTVVLFALFYYFYRENPIKHKFVSEKELARIRRGKGDGNREPVPYLAIITSPAILCCWASAIGNFMGIQVTMQFSPTYLNKVMGYPIELTGTFSAIPQITTFILKLVAGFAADKITCCSPVTSVKVFNTLALGGMAMTFIGLALIPTTMPLFGLVMLIFCCTIIGFNCGAFFRSSAIVAAQHNHFIMGVNSFLNCLASLLSPVIVNIFVANDTWEEWWWVWIVHAIILFIGNIIFLIYGKGEPAEWTKPQASNSVAVTTDEPPRSIAA